MPGRWKRLKGRLSDALGKLTPRGRRKRPNIDALRREVASGAPLKIQKSAIPRQLPENVIREIGEKLKKERRGPLPADMLLHEEYEYTREDGVSVGVIFSSEVRKVYGKLGVKNAHLLPDNGYIASYNAPGSSFLETTAIYDVQGRLVAVKEFKKDFEFISH